MVYAGTAVVGPGLAATGAIVAAGLVIALLESWAPHAVAWRPTRRVLALDAVHTLVTALAIVPALHAGLLVVLAGWFAPGLWPASWPWLVQLALAVVLADLGAYVAHRFMHATDLGWRMHAVHHTPRALNLLASARTHPFNAVLTYTAEHVPLLLLGAPPEVVALWSTIKATNGLLQHSNVSMGDTRMWSLVLATPEVHRWHHSVVLEESTTNFGNTTVVFDRLLGTLHLPADRAPGIEVGIAGVDVPENYLAHLATPWTLPD